MGNTTVEGMGKTLVTGMGNTLDIYTWARLITKVYEVDPLVCPHCGSEMAVVSVITDPVSCKQILEHLRKKNLPPFSHPPPMGNNTIAVKSEPVLV